MEPGDDTILHPKCSTACVHQDSQNLYIKEPNKYVYR
jgi:hypothetical protein